MKKKSGLLVKILISIVIAAISFYLIKVVHDLNILPNNYLILLVLIIITINLVADVCLFIKKVWTKIISIILYVLLIIISIIGINYGSETIKFLNKAFNNNDMEITTYGVIVLEKSNYSKLKDINNKIMGYLSSDINNDECLENINKNINVEEKSYDDLYNLYDNLVDGSLDSILLDMAYLDILEDDYNNITKDVITIYTFDIVSKNELDDIKIENLEPINIYISGSDSRSNKIANKSRSDVNMILTINPNTKKVLMTSIPRDYYVQVSGKKGLKDKLTHSGIYGIDTSRKTLEDLFDIEINYSIKIGMSSVVEVVDLVGGVDIYSDTAFNSSHIPGWKVKKGMNHMDGAKALAYSRERYAYRLGDRHRILNQQQVLEAVLKKVTTNKTILTKYDEFLNSLNNLYRTDIPKEVITLLVKNQLSDMSSWTFESQSVSGSDASLPTYTAPNSKRYVMIPYEKDVKRAHDKIVDVLEERED